MKKIISLSIFTFLVFTLNANGEYKKVDCSTSATFGANSCDACFNGGKITTSSNISFLDDIWINSSNNHKLIYKEEQNMPEMKSLNGATFTKTPNDDTFWEYTEELEALYSKEFEGYVLPASNQVSWIKSSLGASYNFSSLPNKGEEAGILIFDIKSHNVSSEGDIDTKESNHRECVLYTSGIDKVDEVVEEIELNKQEQEISKETKKPVVKEEFKPEIKEVTKIQVGSPLFLISLIFAIMTSLAILRRRK